MKKLKSIILLFILFTIFISNCEIPLTENKVDDPAYIRVWVKFHYPENSAFGKTVQEGDSLKVQCTSFRLYNDSLYANFYQRKNQYRQDRRLVPKINILNQTDTSYRVAYGSVPSYTYDSLRFQMSPLDTSFVINGNTYPLTYQGEFSNTTVNIDRTIAMEQNVTTDIYITFRVDKAVVRKEDMFHLNTVGIDSMAIESIKIKKE